MIDPAVFRAMVANGATPEMLLAVVEAAAAVEEQKKAKKRADAAVRQQRFRDKNKGQEGQEVTPNNASNALQGVTECDSVTAPPSPSPLPSPCTPNQPPAPTHPDINTRGRARVAARMPEGWEPEPLAGPIAEAVAKWPPGALDRELDKFRDWARSTAGPNAKKSDWQATYRNWLRKADEDGKYRNGQRQFDGMGRDRSSPTLGALHDFVNRTPY